MESASTERSLKAIQELGSWADGSDWSGINAWQRPEIVEALIDFAMLSNDFGTGDSIVAAARNSHGLSGVDDDLWSAIAAFKTYYLTGDPYFFSFANYQFQQCTGKYWAENSIYHGGVWWDYKRTAMNAIENELFVYLMTLMYRATNDEKYEDWATKAWTWFKNSGLINGNSLINDGLDKNGDNNGGTTWTYNQGVILGGLVNLYLICEDESYLDQGIQIALSVIRSQELSPKGILNEPGPVNQDRQIFKGIFIRNLGYMASVMPECVDRTTISDFIKSNANCVDEQSSNGQDKINYYWAPGSGTLYGAAAQSAGIDLFNAATRVASEPRQPWSYLGWIENVGTSAPVAPCTHDGSLYIAWKGQSGDDGIWFTRKTTSGWNPQEKIVGAGTRDSPSLASFNGVLHAAWRGSGDDGIWYTELNSPSQPRRIANVGTSTGPALACFNNKLYLAWKGVGSDNEIWFSWLGAGSSDWNSQQQLSGVGTNASPSLATFGDKLYVAWRGCGEGSVWFGSLDQDNNWSGQTQILGAGTNASPSLATFNGLLYAAWRGSGDDDHIWFSSTADGETWNQPTKYLIPGLTQSSPRLAVFEERLWSFWPDAPNISQVFPAATENSICYSFIPCTGGRFF